MGILAHPLFENMVKAGASEFRGDYYSHGKQFIENLPIKIIDPKDIDDVKYYNLIVESVEKLIVTKKQYNDAYGATKIINKRKLVLLNNTLIDTVNKLYGINSDEFNTVLNDEMFKNELTAEDY